MSYDIQGKLFEIYDEQQVTDKFRKKEFVLEVPDGNYTQYIKLQLTQDKCNLLDQFRKGNEVKVAFNLNGKPFTKNGTSMYFTCLTAWKVERIGSPAPATQEPSFCSNDADSDLPF